MIQLFVLLASIIYLERKHHDVFAWQANIDRPASYQGPENGSALFCASVTVVVHTEK